MRKITAIKFLDSFKLLCIFNTGEKRLLDVSKALDMQHGLAKKLTDPKVFSQARVGSCGEIVWEGIGEIKDYNGSVIPCEYDISPEFAYHHSEEI